MLIRFTAGGKPLYLDDKIIKRVSLSNEEGRSRIFTDNAGPDSGMYFWVDGTPDEVIADINQQFHRAATREASIPDEIAFRKGLT